jgi:hypothetical protein
MRGDTTSVPTQLRLETLISPMQSNRFHLNIDNTEVF